CPAGRNPRREHGFRPARRLSGPEQAPEPAVVLASGQRLQLALVEPHAAAVRTLVNRHAVLHPLLERASAARAGHAASRPHFVRELLLLLPLQLFDQLLVPLGEVQILARLLGVVQFLSQAVLVGRHRALLIGSAGDPRLTLTSLSCPATVL